MEIGLSRTMTGKLATLWEPPVRAVGDLLRCNRPAMPHRAQLACLQEVGSGGHDRTMPDPTSEIVEMLQNLVVIAET